MERVVAKIGRGKTTVEDVFNLIIAFFETYSVGPTPWELCRMIDIMHYKEPFTTSMGHMRVMLEELYDRGLLVREKKEKGRTRKTYGRLIVAGARWVYQGEGFDATNARKG